MASTGNLTETFEEGIVSTLKRHGGEMEGTNVTGDIGFEIGVGESKGALRDAFKNLEKRNVIDRKIEGKRTKKVTLLNGQPTSPEGTATTEFVVPTEFVTREVGSSVLPPVAVKRGRGRPRKIRAPEVTTPPSREVVLATLDARKSELVLHRAALVTELDRTDNEIGLIGDLLRHHRA